MTLVHRTLGDRIDTICAECGLTPNEKELLDQLLVQWESLVGDPLGKLEATLGLIGDHPRRGIIIRALTLINVQFAQMKLACSSRQNPSRN